METKDKLWHGDERITKTVRLKIELGTTIS